MSERQDNLNDIAIIGMDARVPGAADVDQFWQLLRDGVESTKFFGGEPQVLGPGVAHVKAAPLMDGAEMFDASFFTVNPREAEIMDPQLRVFLESAWTALEDANCDPKQFAGRISVFGGAQPSSYLAMNLLKNAEVSAGGAGGPSTLILLNERDALTTIVSYKLDLTGPSVTVQTFCSTSLVAIHMACQSLLNGESDVALAGGVTINLGLKYGYVYLEGGMVSPDGHTRTFDERANGTVFGNGVGIVVLKRLSDAIEDGDAIHAIIRGTAINNDGAQKGGYTAPSVTGQSKAIAEAMAIAQVNPETIGYVEAHGTATSIGDPIEIEALTRAFRSGTQKKGFCGIGSVKSNFGHLDRAAGVVSLIKAVLALKHGQMPPSLHFEKPNPRIDFESSPFRVNAELSEWRSNGTPRRAGVSALGVGGTNAHAILEEAPRQEASGPSRSSQVLLLSARTEPALQQSTERLVAYLKANPAISLADVAHTLRVGRRRFEHRRAVVCDSVAEAVSSLETLRAQKVFSGYSQATSRPVVFMFSGQGSQYLNMTRGLYESEPSFRNDIDDCCARLTPHLGLDLRQLLFVADSKDQAASERLNETSITQPALFVVEYALAQLWMRWGVKPQAMIGHSIGEYVAAHLAGVFSLDDALALVAERGRLMQSMPRGSMLAVTMPAAELEPLLKEPVSIAAINGPSLCVASGPSADIDALAELLQRRDIPCSPLYTSHAFHSSMMDPILEPFRRRLEKVKWQAPSIPYISNLTGTWITDVQATDPGYWTEHLRGTVHFAEGVETLWQEPERVLLEVGPGSTLSTLARQQLKPGSTQVTLASTRHPRDPQNDLQVALLALGRLWIAGAEMDWAGFTAGESRNRLRLPTYPFQRERYWIDPSPQTETRRIVTGKNADVSAWFYVPAWHSSSPVQQFDPAEPADEGSWLLLVPGGEWGSRVEDRLREHDLVTVRPGREFAGNPIDGYILNPDAADQFERLFTDLDARGCRVTRVIHAWAVAPAADSDLTAEAFAEAQKTRFHALTRLARALAARSADRAIQLRVITSGGFEVVKGDRISPESSPLLALCKVIPQEHANITCSAIDVDPPDSQAWRDPSAFTRLAIELALDGAGAIVAYRGGQRWVQTFDPLRIPEKTTSTALRERGVYLIVGGLGGVGFALASYLARAVRARLVLTGRSALPPKGHWKTWLDTRGAADPTSVRIRRVRTLEELGAEVLVAGADAADPDAMRAVIQQAESRFGALNGVIYAAGIVTGSSFRPIKDLDPSQCEQQFHPKVTGLIALDQVLGDKPLDFVLLTSSLSSILGGLGYAAYAAANIFEDAYTHYHNQRRSVPWISANWDEWQLSEKAEAAGAARGLAQFAIKPMEGGDAFGRILSLRGVGQVIVSTGNLQTRIDQWIKLEALRAAPASEGKPKIRRHGRPNLQNAYVAPGSETEQKIAEIWQELLGIESVGIHDNFFELGGHSMLGIQLVARVKAMFKADLSVASLFEGPTVHSLCALVEKGDAHEPASFDDSSDRGRRRRERSQERSYQQAELANSEVLN